MYWLHMADLGQRSRFIEHMRDAGVMAAFHYQALHTAPAGWKFGGLPSACPVAESASDCLVRLPLHAGVSVSDRDRVIQAALSFTD
jgi:dTDP-4-amino-4,6-dideoxygalactose transaminase